MSRILRNLEGEHWWEAQKFGGPLVECVLLLWPPWINKTLRDCRGIKAGWKNVTKATGFHVLHTMGKQRDKGRTHLNCPAPAAGRRMSALCCTQQCPRHRLAPVRALPHCSAAPNTRDDAGGRAWAGILWCIIQLSHQFLKHVAELWS